jgi:hypothetical protein
MARRRLPTRPLLTGALALILVAGSTGFFAARLVAAPTTTDVTVAGIEDAIQKLNGLQGHRDAAQAALVLQILRGAGERLPPEAGRSRLAYHIDVTPDGHVIINNIDVSTLIQMANQVKKS